MKRIILTFLLLLLFAVPVCAQEEMPEEWTQVVDEAPMTAEEFRETDISDWLFQAAGTLKEAVRAPLRVFAAATVALVLAALIESMTPSGAAEGISAAMDAAAAVLLFVLCIPALTGVTEYAQQAFADSAQYLTGFVPVFAGVIAACGQTGTAAVYGGLFFTLAMAIANFFSGAGIPFLRMILSLCAVSCVDSGLDTDALTKQMSKWMKWALAAAAAVFTALLGMQGILAQSADSFALKTGKFVVSSGIPVVGKAISDALGTVLAGLHLMKATVGFAVIAVTAAQFVPVLMQCAIYQAVFTAAHAVAAALGVKRAARLLDGFSQCMGLCMAMCGLFGFIVLTATIMMVILGSG